ncbi:MAG: ferritin family protein [Dongiaceae bacterium]
MSLLEQEPPGPIDSVAMLLALARAMEARAAARYRAFAGAMRAAGRADLVPLLERLAGEEERHAAALAARGGEAAEPAAPAPEGHAGDVNPASLTPYALLALAVESEERAFAFYSHVAAAATLPAVRELAEALAREELAHAALLRQERRKAFRAEGVGARSPPDPAAASLAALWASAARLEGRAALQHRQLAAAGGPDAGLLRTIAEEEATAARECAGRIGATPPAVLDVAAAGDPRRPLAAALARYRAIARRAVDAAGAAAAERLAAGVADRLERLDRG